MDGPSLITSLDSGLRGAAIAVFLIVAVSILRQGYRRPVVWLGTVLSIGAAAYAICSLPGNHEYRAAWFAPILALCAGNVAVFWLFTRAAFDDSFRPAPWHGLLWLVLIAGPLADLFGAGLADNLTLEIVRRIVPVGLVVLALAQTIKDWGADLVEGRRRLRLFILGAVMLHSAVSATVDLSIGPEHVPPALHLLNAAALAAIAAVIAMTALHADLDMVFAGPAVAPPVPPAALPSSQEPVDPAVLAELDRLMTVDRLYRQEGLTIGALAAKLGLPEHRLRRTINRGLGFRNFNEYLNGHRLADAKQALADPSQAEVPILTIALDAGFQSLGPFNRAFKADTGMTPTEFRRGSVPGGA